MSFKVVLTDRAWDELDAAYRWYSDRSQQAAVRWYNGFLEALDSLKTNPTRHEFARENGDFPVELRQLLYGRKRNWRAIFTIRGDTVVVLFIRHSARRDLTPDDV
jgi:plasmid stabilization system protein ParE